MTFPIRTRLKPRLLAVPFIAAMCCAAAAPASQAQTAYPTKPITVVVPFTPAGATDVVTRLVTDTIAKNTGWNFIVDNRPGAGGNIGLQAVARSAPDGYTIGMG